MADDDADHRICEPVRFAVLTPDGRGAIATVAVWGREAARAVGRRFGRAGGKSLADSAVGRVAFGRFQTAADCTEELVVGIISTDEVEIHCHGGRTAVAAICDALAAEGCIQVEPTDWLHHQSGDPLAAEALLALAEVRTERTAAVLLDQYGGALLDSLGWIDRCIVAGEYTAAAKAIKTLLARAAIGRHLTEPWRVAIAGRPNAGKSSLMNALVGYERAIVFAEPGTTRDVLTAFTAIGGWPIDLLDTAGLRTSSQSIEAEGIARAEEQISSADLVLLVADLTEPWDGELQQRVNNLIAIQQTPGSPPRMLIVHNKRDLLSVPADNRPAGIWISARTGNGIDTLCQAITQTLIPVPPQPSDAVPFQPRHVSGLTTAAAELANGNVELATRAIRGIVCLSRDWRPKPLSNR